LYFIKNKILFDLRRAMSLMLIWLGRGTGSDFVHFLGVETSSSFVHFFLNSRCQFHSKYNCKARLITLTSDTSRGRITNNNHTHPKNPNDLYLPVFVIRKKHENDGKVSEPMELASASSVPSAETSQLQKEFTNPQTEIKDMVRKQLIEQKESLEKQTKIVINPPPQQQKTLEIFNRRESMPNLIEMPSHQKELIATHRDLQMQPREPLLHSRKTFPFQQKIVMNPQKEFQLKPISLPQQKIVISPQMPTLPQNPPQLLTLPPKIELPMIPRTLLNPQDFMSSQNISIPQMFSQPKIIINPPKDMERLPLEKDTSASLLNLQIPKTTKDSSTQISPKESESVSMPDLYLYQDIKEEPEDSD
jgi:hypothetical protein